MPGFIERFKIPEPVTFKEKGCDTEFKVSVDGAIYVDFYDEEAFGETRNEQIENMKTLAAGKVCEDLAHWHEGDKLLRYNGRDVLGDSLSAFLREKGITGSARINTLEFTEESEELYQKLIIDPHNKKKSEEFQKKLEAAVEPHGPLISVSYNLSSHGMMAGTSSNSQQRIEWKEDGSIIYESSSSFSGKNFVSEYKIKPETAQKMMDFAEEKKLAALSKLDIETPVMFDSFTSSTIVVTYDDRSVGGEYRNMYSINCGPAGMTFKSLEDKIKDLFKEIEESGECIKNEMNENSTPMPGFMGMGLGMMNIGGEQNTERPVELMGLVAADPDAGKEKPDTNEKWICKCGQENTGKFCFECGQPKPSGWTCACGSENTGNFCPNCGAARKEPKTFTCECGYTGPAQNFCPDCGKKISDNTVPAAPVQEPAAPVEAEAKLGWKCPKCGAGDQEDKCSVCGADIIPQPLFMLSTYTSANPPVTTSAGVYEYSDTKLLFDFNGKRRLISTDVIDPAMEIIRKHRLNEPDFKNPMPIMGGSEYVGFRDGDKDISTSLQEQGYAVSTAKIELMELFNNA